MPLGYTVHMHDCIYDISLGVTICVQGSHNPKYVESRIDNFIARMETVIEQLDEPTFEAYRRKVIDALSRRQYKGRSAT